MEFGGRYILVAERLAVWAALNDTEILKAAIPGCHRIDWVGEAELELEFKVNLGLMQPVLKGELELTDILPARRYTLHGRGKGGLLGLAEGYADIDLSDADEGNTLLVFSAEGGASGQLMNLGKPIIQNSAQRVIDGFFARFAKAMGTTATPLPAPPEG